MSAGHNYQLVVTSTTQPHYVYAAPDPVSPRDGDNALQKIGKNKWAITVHLPNDLFKEFHTWTLGVRVGTRLHRITIT